MTATASGARAHLNEFERRCGKFGEREYRQLGLFESEWRDSGAGSGQLTVTGHAAIFNRKSLDLGGFQEIIAPGAFTAVLDKHPDCHLLWDHDTRYTLARTTNKTLDLQEDPRGLRFWARVAPTSYAADLRILMERGDIDQASFAFTVANDIWEIATDANGVETVTRTILEVEDLYDVTICAQGAYPQSDSSVVRKYIHEYALERIAETNGEVRELNGLESAALVDPADAATVAQDELAGGVAAARIAALKTDIRRRRLNATT